MINYLDKYNNLPKEIRDKVSSKQVMDSIHELEKRYDINLASLVMRIIVGDLKIDDLHSVFVYKYNFDEAKAKKVVMELDAKIFSRISSYLTYINTKKEPTDAKEGESGDLAKAGGADFYFSIDDEEEVRQKAQDLSAFDNREQLAKQVELKIDDILSKMNVIFSSEDMLNRLRQILRTHLRGVRNFVDTKMVLEREVNNGGLGLDEEISDDILKIVNIIKKDEASHPERLFKPKKIAVPEDKMTDRGGGDVEYDFSKLKKDKAPEQSVDKGEESDNNLPPITLNMPKDKEDQEEHIEEGGKNEQEGKEDKITNKTKDELKNTEKMSNESIQSSTSEANDSSGSDSVDRKSEKKSEELILDLKKPAPLKPEPEKKEEAPNTRKDEDTKEPATMSARTQKPDKIKFKPITKPEPTPDSGKVRMHDIKRVARQGGPLGEVSSMRLVDFRRLDDSPQVAVKKVLEMFEILEEESFAKKMEGIKAWRKSPLNKLYLSIGQESISGGKNVKEVFEARKAQNKDSLTEEEFNAIMSLNKKLRY